MAARSWLLLLCLAAATTGVLQAQAQPDSVGFISIDCGLTATASFVDNTTKLAYVSDAGFIAAGSNHNISSEYIFKEMNRRYLNLRSFPDGARNCYTLRSLMAGLKYLIRATFMYGNYDGLGRLPAFDLYIGVNFWTLVNMTSPDGWLILEATVVVPDDFVQICLVNTGSGTPFITALDLRPLKSSLYPQVNATQGLNLIARLNYGSADVNVANLVRYPDDPHDRVWIPVGDDSSWTTISTTRRVQNVENALFDPPSKVMQTAVTPRNGSRIIEVFWEQEPQPKDQTPGYIAILHFAEIEVLTGNASREFYVNLNGELWYEKAFTPPYLYHDATYNSNPVRRASNRYNISLNATANSTLPPIINAIELFSVFSTSNLGTDSKDVSAITAIQKKYTVKKNWMGDPCLPKTLAWDGVTCSYAVSSPPRITGLNLSSSGLSGDITSSFANLKALQHLYISENNLTGSIPDALSQISSLTFLDLTGNQLDGRIPSGLLQRIKDGSLNLRYENNPNVCTNGDSCRIITKGKSKLAMYIAIPVALVVAMVLAALLLLCFCRRKQQGSMNNSVKPQNETPMSHVPSGEPSSLKLENRRFSYKELEAITNNFQRVLGRGGFGSVYDGFLEDGTQVAVKLRSESSNQGVKEFLAEAQILTRIHHKNLVSMIGYCKDGEYMALVYEYMPEGTLQEHIKGNGHNRRLLTWRQRVKIALESAQGLEYLHNGCNPPLIHRDVKAANILLDANLEAKVADFGLSKAFNRDNDTHVSTSTLVGTPGYVDPEYQTTMQPTTKSDVYSFGVVLLEMITGRPAILRDPEPVSIIQWTRQRLARGNIESVVDPRMSGDHDVNSVWKAADIALKCTAMASTQRPTMTDVVGQLQECLELEQARAVGHGDLSGGFYASASSDPYSGYNQYATDRGQSASDASQNSTFEVDRNFGRVPTGPSAR